MYGVSYSHRHIEACLYAAILFASFATMAAVMDLEELTVLDVESAEHRNHARTCT